MHDPMTVAFDIKYPWREFRPWPKSAERWENIPPGERKGRSPIWKEGYRATMITIWHVDPETDGSDDSCGWFSPKLDETTREKVWLIAKEQCGEHALFRPFPNDEGVLDRFESCRDPFSTVIDCLQIIAWRIFREKPKPKYLPDILDLAASAFDGFYDSVQGPLTQEQIVRSFMFMTRSYARIRRPWWKHPRWHVHHWRFQVHPVHQFKRWAFTHCEGCGRGFAWGACPISTAGWGDKGGPRWFRSEKSLYHHECYNSKIPEWKG